MFEECSAPPGMDPPTDWRNPTRYESLRKADRTAWAWQWLRRNPAFAAMAMAVPQFHVQTAPRVITLSAPFPGIPWGVLFRRGG